MQLIRHADRIRAPGRAFPSLCRVAAAAPLTTPGATHRTPPYGLAAPRDDHPDVLRGRGRGSPCTPVSSGDSPHPLGFTVSRRRTRSAAAGELDVPATCFAAQHGRTSKCHGEELP